MPFFPPLSLSVQEMEWNGPASIGLLHSLAAMIGSGDIFSDPLCVNMCRWGGRKGESEKKVPSALFSIGFDILSFFFLFSSTSSFAGIHRRAKSKCCFALSTCSHVAECIPFENFQSSSCDGVQRKLDHALVQFQ